MPIVGKLLGQEEADCEKGRHTDGQTKYVDEGVARLPLERAKGNLDVIPEHSGGGWVDGRDSLLNGCRRAKVTLKSVQNLQNYRSPRPSLMSFTRIFTAVFVVVFAAVIWTGCASAPVIVEEAPLSIPASPLDGMTAVLVDDAGLTLRRSVSQEQRYQATGPVTYVSAAPDESAVVISVGGSLIAVPREEGMINVLESGDAARVYTGAWSKDGSRFYFGFYVPAGDGMGAGGIRTWDRAADEVRDVGCSASKVVLAELASGSLLVRNVDNIYEVQTEGCATMRSVDARKMHKVTVSPDGAYLAYILRELVFNRENRSYEPDSTLYVESSTGGEAIKVIGDKYTPRNLSWRPDGSELLYDVAPPGGEAQRAVSVYTLSDARSTYVLPPNTSTAATEALMAPGGQHVLFRQSSSDGISDWQIKTTGSNFAQSIPMPNGAVVAAYWLDGNRLLIRTVETSAVVSVAGATPSLTDLEASVIWAW